MQERCRHNFCYKTCANTNIVITLHYITLHYKVGTVSFYSTANLAVSLNNIANSERGTTVIGLSVYKSVRGPLSVPSLGSPHVP